MRIRMMLLAAALLAAGCTGSDQAEDTTTRAPFTTAPTTTSTTNDSASSSVPGPPAVAGIWLAELGGVVLQFRIDERRDQELTGLFDSPMEWANDLPIVITTDESDVTIEIPVASAVFEGTVTADSLSGVWKQAGAEVPLVFVRQGVVFSFAGSLEQQPPYPFESHAVRFVNGPIALSGRLVIPE